MQEAAFSRLGLKAFYLAFEFNPSEFTRALRGLGHFLLDGFNVTVPYKEKVIPFLDRLSPEAKAVGAVNTVYREGRKWVGTNTDIYGFLTALRRAGFNPKNKKVLMLGAGGAARAAVYGLASQGASEIRIANRRPERARKTARDFQIFFPKAAFTILPLSDERLKNSLKEMDLVVNATSVGLAPGDPVLVSKGLIPKATRRKRILFFDLIYSRRTSFLKAARSRGHKTLGGLTMLLYQGANALELWTGRKAPVDVMRRTLIQSLKAEGNSIGTEKFKKWTRR